MYRVIEWILRIKGYPRNVAVSVLATSLVVVNQALLSMPLPLVLELQGIKEHTGVVMAVFAVAAVIGSFLAGTQSILFGARSTGLLGLVLMGVGSIGYAFDSLTVLIIARVIQGYAFGLSLAAIGMLQWVGVSKPEQGRATAAVSAANAFSWFAGPISFWLISELTNVVADNRLVYSVWVAVGLMTMLLAIRILLSLESRPKQSKVHARTVREWVAKNIHGPSYATSLLNVGMVVFYWQYMSYMPMYSSYGKDIIFLTVALSVIAALVTGRFADSRHLILLSRVTMVLSVFFVIHGEFWSLVVAAILMSFGYRANWNGTVQKMQSQLPEHLKANATSAWQTSLNIGNAIGFWIGGSVGSATNYTSQMWWFALPFVVCSALVALPWKNCSIRRRPR
ncbi:Predicted arabinose efflux permease, MFS family [Seinonella peptonophila]|uniref:Predicted arabinose efflux permease, MFS family n=1 Tax=Seinonella peptonophila TaxID=112248 RepID=A0A1M4X7C4_9BACL|nr:MFS transporter [Seinonella peptonophila]SHE89351.1 Predicted arabinose efflux permease, MFS family [Seinonella peptonophila]